MKPVVVLFLFNVLFSVSANAQNLALSCDSSDFHISGLIVEDAHGFVFEVRDLEFLVKDAAPALNIRYGSAWATAEGRALRFDMPDGREVLIEIKDRGDSDYSRAAAVIRASGFAGKSVDLECAAATSP